MCRHFSTRRLSISHHLANFEIEDNPIILDAIIDWGGFGRQFCHYIRNDMILLPTIRWGAIVTLIYSIHWLEYIESIRDFERLLTLHHDRFYQVLVTGAWVILHIKLQHGRQYIMEIFRRCIASKLFQIGQFREFWKIDHFKNPFDNFIKVLVNLMRS